MDGLIKGARWGYRLITLIALKFKLRLVLARGAAFGTEKLSKTTQ